MIYTIEEAIENIRKFNVGDIVKLNDEFDMTQNDYYQVNEDEKAKFNTPYLITNISCEFNISEINTYLLSSDNRYDKEIEGEMLYQLFNISNNCYCGVLVNSEEVDRVGGIK
ncbi:hypothetical protein H3997_11095 [Staphylococcus epidermidis]|uniref:hypothetical protein n=1 Tax=Bacillati TaxID=1783272 RepID=UPI000F52A8C0|nr:MULTISPECIES: hypothetical protein [Staphylococcus]MBF2142273.1 hypothetical protein [Staphylococcus epidermidis]MBF2226356.1 hypothetical protein [Staphylococcus epidermidis]MCD9074474.1 hypothetical protein [Staphylococcus epidermidis]RQN00776.1 hypothetical protein CPA43_01045 [Staphylococcus warneri]